MRPYYILWTLLSFTFFYDIVAQRQDFEIDDFNMEKKKWDSLHLDVFDFSSQNQEQHHWSDLATGAAKAGGIDEIHSALKDCHNIVHTYSKKASTGEINVQRLVRHLLNIRNTFEEDEDTHIHISIAEEDLETLNKYLESGKFESTQYSSIYDLLKKILKPRRKSIGERLSYITLALSFLSDKLTDLVSGIVFLLRRLADIFTNETTDLVIYSTLILPPLVFFDAIRRGRSLWYSTTLAAVAVMFIGYAVEIQAAVKTAQAEEMAKMIQQESIPIECQPDQMNIYQSLWSGIKSLFTTDDRCVSYMKQQYKVHTIRPQEIFWKMFLSPFIVGMENFGKGLGTFIKVFGSHFGYMQAFILLPSGMIALLYMLTVTLAAITGGRVSFPFFGTIDMAGSAVLGRGLRSESEDQTERGIGSSGPQGPAITQNAQPPAIINLNVNVAGLLSRVTETLQLPITCTGEGGNTFSATVSPPTSRNDTDESSENAPVGAPNLPAPERPQVLPKIPEKNSADKRATNWESSARQFVRDHGCDDRRTQPEVGSGDCNFREFRRMFSEHEIRRRFGHQRRFSK